MGNGSDEQGEGEAGYYGRERAVAPGGLPVELEENVMDRLQKTAEELGIQIV